VNRLGKEESAEKSKFVVVIVRTEEQHSDVVYRGPE